MTAYSEVSVGIMVCMKPKDCPECHRLRERFWEVSTELDRAKDELKMTRKTAVDYEKKSAEVRRLKGLVKQAATLSENHSVLHRDSVD